MSKHRHQSKAEQIYNKTRGAVSFHNGKTPYQYSELRKVGAIEKEPAEEEGFMEIWK
jgi:hypothetical protein